MSWIRGSIILKDLSEKSLKTAYQEIRYKVRKNSDLEEFPNMGDSLLPYRIKESGVTATSLKEAERQADSYSWNRKYNIIIPFIETNAASESSKMRLLKEQIDKEINKKINYEKKHSVLTFKAAFVACPECGSKLNRTWLKNDVCPVCSGIMRSQTTKNELKRYTEKISSLKKELAKLKKDAEKKAIVKSKKNYVLFFEEYVG